MPLEAARPALSKFAKQLPAALKAGASPLTEAQWNAWIRSEDASIRRRLVQGEADTVTNLLRFGVTFTTEPRIDRESLAQFGSGGPVDAIASRRADALIKALAASSANSGLREIRSFLATQGFSFQTPQAREKLKKYLIANLAHMRDEFAEYRQKLKSGNIVEESTLYADRGISLDTNLWPDYALDLELSRMARDASLKPGQVRRVAIIGPGLDFANKELGEDYYPPQTIQPFAIMDSLIRLKLADPAAIEIVTLDISPRVNIHIARARKDAAAGEPYTLQLPWDSKVPRSKEYLDGFVPYWEALGASIGKPVSPIAPPTSIASEVRVRAVRVRPQSVLRVTPLDANIVFQRFQLAPAEKFDLIIGTNIFIYYDAFEQSLARANVSTLLRPGGYLLTNEFLNDSLTFGLPVVHRARVVASQSPLITDNIFCYQLRP